LPNNTALKVLAGLAGGALATAYVLDLRKRLRKDIAMHKKKEPYRLLDYMLSRVVVICPQCGHIVTVSTLEAQMSSMWKCFKCGCSWREQSDRDVIIDEGRRG